MAEKKVSKFLYLDIANLIIAEYKDMPYFSPIKSERELCEEYGVSRPTIRKALEILSNQNKIIKVPGKGAVYAGKEIYVQSSGIEEKSSISFFNNATLHGNYVKNKVLLQNVIDAPLNVALRLNIDENTKVFNLQRLRELDGNICSLESSYIPYRLCPDLIKVDFGEVPLHNHLLDCGIHIKSATRIIEVVKANEFDALHLQIEPYSDVMLIQTICYDDLNKVIEYVIAKVPTDKVRIEFKVENND